MEVAIGKVTHYYDHIGVAVMTLEDSLKLGDKIHIVGHSTDLIQRISSIQIEHHGVVWVKPGDNVAIRVIEPVHEHNIVYRIVEEIAEPVA
jgi:hypothetical protein